MFGATTPRDGADEPAVMRVSSLAPAWETLSRLAGRASAAGGRGAGVQDAGVPSAGVPSAGVQDAGGAPAAPAGSGSAHTLRSAVLVTGAIGAVVGAGFAAWQRRERTPTIDPWVAATAQDLGVLSRSEDDRPGR